MDHTDLAINGVEDMLTPSARDDLGAWLKLKGYRVEPVEVGALLHFLSERTGRDVEVRVHVSRYSDRGVFFDLFCGDLWADQYEDEYSLTLGAWTAVKDYYEGNYWALGVGVVRPAYEKKVSK